MKFYAHISKIFLEEGFEEAVTYAKSAAGSNMNWQIELDLLHRKFLDSKRLERLGLIGYGELEKNRNRIYFSLLDIASTMSSSIQKPISKESDQSANGINPARLKMIDEKPIEGCWISLSDAITVYFWQNEEDFVGIYGFGVGRYAIKGLFIGAMQGKVAKFSWRWLDKLFYGLGQGQLEREKLYGFWWFDPDMGTRHELSFEFQGKSMPEWLGRDVLHKIVSENKVAFKKVNPLDYL